MKRFSAVFIEGAEIRRMTFEAKDDQEALNRAKIWGVGLDGEVKYEDAVKAEPPQAFSMQEARRLLGGMSRSSIYNLIHAGYLERLDGTRRVMITRKSIERYAAARN